VSGEAAPYLEIEGLGKTYPGVVALSDASLTIDHGEIVGLVGKNGAGKSTFIKIMAGAVQPDHGTLKINGMEQRFVRPHDSTLAGLSFVHQELEEVGDLTVAENIFLGLGYPKVGGFIRWKKLYADAARILGRLGADIRPDVQARTLAPVGQRMVMIARALAAEAGFIALDEPSASLPQEEIDHLHGVIRRLAADGVCVMYVSHRLEEILELTQRTVVMRNGTIAADMPTADLTRPELVDLVTGAVTIATTPSRVRMSSSSGAIEPVLTVERLIGPVISDDIRFDLRAGEILGIAGMVGSGRTEMLRALFGANRGSSATVRLGGREVTITSPRQAIREGILLLPEDRRREGSVLTMSVRHNLTLPTLKGQRWVGALPFPSPQREHATALRVIDDLRVRTATDKVEVRTLSGGNQQKIVVGKWVDLPSKVLMFDEPTQGIDVGAKAEVFQIMDRLAKTGRGLLLVSSDFSELVAVCDRVLVLREGHLVGEFTGDDITESNLVRACYAHDDAVTP
jgi:ABC-type sugar transport system ATPase subunit